MARTAKKAVDTKRKTKKSRMTKEEREELKRTEEERRAEEDAKKREEDLNEILNAGKEKGYTVQSLTVEEFLNNRDKYDDNIKLQRQAGQWSDKAKSWLIYSIIVNNDISEITIVEQPNNKDIHYIIDGKQRITTIEEFCNDEFALSAELNNMALINMKFSELDDNIQAKIKSYKLRLIALNGYSEKEIKEMFGFRNSGIPLNISQKMKNTLEDKRLQVLDELTEHNAYNKFNISSKSSIDDSNRDLLIKALLLINNPDISNFATKKIYKDINVLSDEEFDNAFEEVKNSLDIIDSSIKGKGASLKKATIPFLIYGVAIGKDANRLQTEIFDNENSKFYKHTHNGTTSKVSIQSRREIIDKLK